ncbi:gas vesicle protein GvpO [Actinacidiphila acidipaludis]|uniref:Gas vesicle protein n=1 Tax=Actinacidiphila acidipaludis TaxID=2873382 RepID=A0ABS7PZ14_9ACTN|nr:gas vesicle protein GvpO [Streptomyces acidipaludis]MBY8876113.1 gas vesicle protein [Streptomyces acidipaludis]
MAEQQTRSRPAARRSKARERVNDAAQAAQAAADRLSELVDHTVEGASAVTRRDDDGWRVGVDVIEVRRIPDTTSLMATYEVDLDSGGALLGYRRVRRYRRCDADE